MRQVSFLYYRDRDKEGKAKVLPYYFKDKKQERDEQLAMFRMFGAQIGKTPEEIESIIKNAENIGSISKE